MCPTSPSHFCTFLFSSSISTPKPSLSPFSIVASRRHHHSSLTTVNEAPPFASMSIVATLSFAFSVAHCCRKEARCTPNLRRSLCASLLSSSTFVDTNNCITASRAVLFLQVFDIFPQPKLDY